MASDHPSGVSSSSIESDAHQVDESAISTSPQISAVVELLTSAFGMLQPEQGSVEHQAQQHIQQAIDLLTGNASDKSGYELVCFVVLVARLRNDI